MTEKSENNRNDAKEHASTRREEVRPSAPPDKPSRSEPSIDQPQHIIEQVTAALGPVFPPFLHKIEAKQISETIAAADRQDEREHRARTTMLRYGTLWVVLGIALVVFFTFKLGDNPDLFKFTLTAIISGGIGFLGGWGFGSRRK